MTHKDIAQPTIAISIGPEITTYRTAKGSGYEKSIVAELNAEGDKHFGKNYPCASWAITRDYDKTYVIGKFAEGINPKYIGRKYDPNSNLFCFTKPGLALIQSIVAKAFQNKYLCQLNIVISLTYSELEEFERRFGNNCLLNFRFTDASGEYFSVEARVYASQVHFSVDEIFNNQVKGGLTLKKSKMIISAELDHTQCLLFNNHKLNNRQSRVFDEGLTKASRIVFNYLEQEKKNSSRVSLEAVAHAMTTGEAIAIDSYEGTEKTINLLSDTEHLFEAAYASVLKFLKYPARNYELIITGPGATALISVLFHSDVRMEKYKVLKDRENLPAVLRPIYKDFNSENQVMFTCANSLYQTLKPQIENDFRSRLLKSLGSFDYEVKAKFDLLNESQCILATQIKHLLIKGYTMEAILSQGVFPILNEMEDGFVVGLDTLSHSKDEKDQALAKLMAAHFNSTS